MAWPTIILVFVVVWWMVFFTMLPVGVKSQLESTDERVPGTEPGAPVKHNLVRKALITTAVAVVLTLVFYFVEGSDLISFRAPR